MKDFLGCIALPGSVILGWVGGIFVGFWIGWRTDCVDEVCEGLPFLGGLIGVVVALILYYLRTREGLARLWEEVQAEQRGFARRGAEARKKRRSRKKQHRW